MLSAKKLREDVDNTKRELKNLRQEIRKQDSIMKSELNKFKSLFCETQAEIESLEKSRRKSDDFENGQSHNDRKTNRTYEKEIKDLESRTQEIIAVQLQTEYLKCKAKHVRELEREAFEEADELFYDVMGSNYDWDRKSEACSYPLIPIGYISSCFKFKNGIPRQPSLCPSAKGTLKIEKSVFNNPEHSLIGLEEFSHVWILFIFHQTDNVGVKAKVHPPRLNGTSVGVFSTRSPHRPSAVGLSLTKLDKIKGDTLFLSGIDLLDGTPVIDIKPYIPMYDNPFHIKVPDLEKCENSLTENSDLLKQPNDNCEPNELEKDISNLKLTSEETPSNSSECKVPEFLREPPKRLKVVFTNRALCNLESIQVNDAIQSSSKDNQCLDDKRADIKKAITEVLQNDPRSVYRKEKCSDKLYYFFINNIHITCWFDDDTAEVLRIKLSDSTSIES